MRIDLLKYSMALASGSSDAGWRGYTLRAAYGRGDSLRQAGGGSRERGAGDRATQTRCGSGRRNVRVLQGGGRVVRRAARRSLPTCVL